MTTRDADKIARALNGYTEKSLTIPGLSTTFLYDGQGKSATRFNQDVTAAMRHCKEMRNEHARNRTLKNSNGGARMIAEVPVAVLEEIKAKRGIDYRNPSHARALLGEIQRNYSAFKTVEDDISKVRV